MSYDTETLDNAWQEAQADNLPPRHRVKAVSILVADAEDRGFDQGKRLWPRIESAAEMLALLAMAAGVALVAVMAAAGW
jgi:hypothetical protein